MSEIRVLYIEDEPFLGKIVRESLETRGLVVKHLPDGREAMRVCADFQPDICVLDVMLPFDDGFTIGQTIRGCYPTLPIIYLTAKDQTEDVLAGFSSGGNDYIRKPFSMEELIARIHNVLQLSGKVSENSISETIHIGRYEFYPVRQELLINGQIRRLSHRETQLLLLLSSQINQPVQRKNILDALWGNDSFFNSRNLDVYITKLREYLREDTGVEIITLKGVGYRLVG